MIAFLALSGLLQFTAKWYEFLCSILNYYDGLALPTYQITRTSAMKFLLYYYFPIYEVIPLLGMYSNFGAALQE